MNSMKGIDYGYGKPGGKVIKDAGYEFVGRYLSHNPGKNMTYEELKDLHSNGLKVILVWETTITRPLDGKQAGIQDAYYAQGLLKDLGYPETVLYFACDNDYNPDQILEAEKYIRGALSVLGLSRIGVYGGYNTIKHMFDVGVVKYGWQTLAWSHGNWDERAQVRQTNIYGPKLNGVECDTDISITDNIGTI
jgi:hypothetical protein